MASQLVIDGMQRSDWARVRSIYTEGLATGLAAFMLTAPIWKIWDAGHLSLGRLVARQDGAILGWAALTPVDNA
jgi:L-amino acid N-acyltransferase YncA